MGDALTNLDIEIHKFMAWAHNYPIEQRGGEWECDGVRANS